MVVGVWALWMVVLLPNGMPTQLRNNEMFQTEQECLEVGKVKAAQVAQAIADTVGAPVPYEWACIKEGTTT